jgi:hypothetical protein
LVLPTGDRSDLKNIVATFEKRGAVVQVRKSFQILWWLRICPSSPWF